MNSYNNNVEYNRNSYNNVEYNRNSYSGLNNHSHQFLSNSGLHTNLNNSNNNNMNEKQNDVSTPQSMIIEEKSSEETNEDMQDGVLRNAFGNPVDDYEILYLFDFISSNSDGRISFKDFGNACSTFGLQLSPAEQRKVFAEIIWIKMVL